MHQHQIIDNDMPPGKHFPRRRAVVFEHWRISVETCVPERDREVLTLFKPVFQQ